MACVELCNLTREDGPSEQCHAVDWHIHAPPCQGQPDESEGRTRALAAAAECCERRRKATQRAAMAGPCQAPLSSLSPGCTSAGEVLYHPRLSKEDTEADPKRSCCCQSETSFTCVDENVNNLDPVGRLAHRSCCPDQGFLPHPNPCEEVASDWPYEPPSLASEDEEDAGSEAAGGKSVDYGFISAILFLVSGIFLVIVSYVVPRDVTVDPSTVAAREMERLENESAKIGAHLDRCVIAGLCLLTLGGVVLSSLLMMSMWKGELYRRHRFASSKESAKLYGSFNFRMKSSANDNMELSLVEEDVLAIES